MNITFTISRYPAETLGEFLKKLRLERGLDRKELAKKLQVHRNSIYEWENDKHRPYGKTMEKLAEFFKISRKAFVDFKRRERKIFE